MSRDTASGTILIAGALAFVAVMAFHPTSHGLMSEETFAWTALVNRAVHSLAIAAAPALFLGLLGVARRVGPSDLAVAALVGFGFGSVAVMLAAAASGFVFPGVLERVASVAGEEAVHGFLVYTTVWNQTFAKVHVVAWCVSTILLAAAILRARSTIPFASGTAWSGVAVSAAALGLFLSGHLRLDLHGARILWVGQAAWLLWLGVVMCLPSERRSA